MLGTEVMKYSVVDFVRAHGESWNYRFFQLYWVNAFDLTSRSEFRRFVRKHFPNVLHLGRMLRRTWSNNKV